LEIGITSNNGWISLSIIVAFTLYCKTGDTPARPVVSASVVEPAVLVDKWETYNFESSVLDMRLDNEEVGSPSSVSPVSSKMYLNRLVKPSFKSLLFVVVLAGAYLLLAVSKPPASATSG
jgi:hypothetical protein